MGKDYVYNVWKGSREVEVRVHKNSDKEIKLKERERDANLRHTINSKSGVEKRKFN